MPFSKFLKRAALLAILLAVALAALAYRWAHQPVRLAASPIDVAIQPRSALPAVLTQLQAGGVTFNHTLFTAMTRLLRLDTSIKSGNYEFQTGTTPYQLLLKLARGDVNQSVVTVIEGWTFARMRAEIDQNPDLKHDTLGLSEAALLARIGAAESKAEGLFFPDTYLFARGTSDVDIYTRAYRVGRLRLAEAWRERAADLPYRTPYEALIAASLIEKETGRGDERGRVSAVFANRLRVGMPLQTDPSVVYGLTTPLDKRLRRRDLTTDTPYNTYTRPGLPPTPIALPGMAALEAAVHPVKTDALYFVARGDGSSEFSNSLDAHNRAVNRYQRGQ
ncbi:endolytic transglycosylase MltG [Chitinasiproducens palmae]|uniref:Endolytic murein transglycosylase n=1 Tax=Chitinasiproducens palmae TaxID=1770053 RepID=A0A1H2PVX8_9BURK|nr:endolytic transglycosylase MltG [Chitinasiproducens palmae]SDV51454.1 UPF0755 protein [Chitinasiproducens palmae]